MTESGEVFFCDASPGKDVHSSEDELVGGPAGVLATIDGHQLSVVVRRDSADNCKLALNSLAYEVIDALGLRLPLQPSGVVVFRHENADDGATLTPTQLAAIRSALRSRAR